NGAGSWTVSQNATSTGYFALTNAAGFTLASSTTLEVDGAFSNAVGGSATTFTGSTLYLNSGTSYSLNTKSAGGDSYGTLLVGANTHIKTWNSSAATATTLKSASLYSQNNAAVSGNLYIWGNYVSTSSEYWADATDFDGTALGVPRQANVFIASSSVLTLSGTTTILGIASASTTIQNQGNGAYSLNITDGNLDAQYYTLRNTDGSGLNLSGSPTVSTLSNGDYQLAVSGGTMLTVAASVIDSNPLEVFSSDKFATSSG